MGYDLTKSLLDARKLTKVWTLESFWRCIQTIIAGIPHTKLNFDFDAGERWAGIHKESGDRLGEAIALVRLDLPLVIIVEDWADKVEDLLTNAEIVIISVPDMASKVCSLDPSKIETIFPSAVWSPVIDPHCFSIGDLWYTTVT